MRLTVPGCTVEYSPDGGPDLRCYRVDCSRIANELPGFQPQWNVRRGAQQLFETYARRGVRLDDFEGPRFRRIDQIKQLLKSGQLDESLMVKFPIKSLAADPRWSAPPSPSWEPGMTDRHGPLPEGREGVPSHVEHEPRRDEDRYRAIRVRDADHRAGT